MPKDVKQKSGIIAGVNAGHSTSAHSPRSRRPDSTPQNQNFWMREKIIG